MRFLRAPALHFVLIGAAMLVLDVWRESAATVDEDPAARTIIVSSTTRERMREEWRQQWGTVPSVEEEEALVRQFIDDEVLYREALRHGIARGDRVIDTRLEQLADFLGVEGTREERIEAAIRLGLLESDLVIRRYLIQAMRLLGSRLGAGDEPTEDDLRAWLATHAARFEQPPRFDLVHVYLSRDRRRAALQDDARALLAGFERDRTNAAAALERGVGDPFIRGNEVRAASANDLDETFGPGFGAAVAAAPLQAWHGPVSSAYGLHLVWVRLRRPSEMPMLESVRSQVLHGVRKDRADARLRERLTTWRERYVVVIEGPRA